MEYFRERSVVLQVKATTAYSCNIPVENPCGSCKRTRARAPQRMADSSSLSATEQERAMKVRVVACSCNPYGGSLLQL